MVAKGWQELVDFLIQAVRAQARRTKRSEAVCTSVACVRMRQVLLLLFAFSTAGAEKS
jgi:hypothetical protein